jgi:pimeloyl-ACP methyl ester carboxylesterase
VFLHGLGGNGEAILGAVADEPALGGHRSLLIDLPGHGASDRPADFSYSLDDHAAASAQQRVFTVWTSSGTASAPTSRSSSRTGIRDS